MLRTLEGRTVRGLGFGAVAGLLAWIIIEKSGWFSGLLEFTGGITPGSRVYWLQVGLGGIYGLIVAIGIALSDWTAASFRGPGLRVFVLRILGGISGGGIGMIVGFWAYNAIFPSSDLALAPTGGRLVLGVVARAIGWALLGMVMGLAQGGIDRSIRAAGLGAIGGFMGGLCGGGFFEAMEVATSNPTLARLLGFVFLGASLGFFLKFVPVMLKQAWVRVHRDGRDGAEHILQKRWTSIGRSETADISLFGNPAVAPIHFLIETRPAFSLLRPAHKSPADSEIAPIIVNGAAIDSDTPLKGGELIEVGSFTLEFFLKESSHRPGNSPPVRSTTAKLDRQVVRLNGSKVPRAAYSGTAAAPLSPEEVGHVATSRRIADDGLTGTKLYCAHGPYFDQTFALATRNRLVLGRGSDADLSLANDKAVSRNHCAVLLVSGRHWIDDIESSNGTFLNGARLKPREPVMLRLGDEIKIGDTALQYQ